ncbi:DoxX family protein [Streptomyces aidingensis]|uniref:Thiosulfate dehydrogenase [quinone] large subunit n=1 Tax=Streptomyces aidingensis TaxID=910347 RepID=A0A1I1EBK7_9ACTN|nr:DoxX family protein [Streptomyces aidingensis]SFB84514.1 thiosulfate dehydrogenase [quinone] large subunit [Streptomyces aidingensis]
MSVTEQLGGPAARGPLPGTGGPGAGLRERAAHYALLPLRLFLGFTFLYAGIDKYTTWGPFSPMDRTTMESMLEFAEEQAAAPWLADLALENPGLFLNATSVAEIAVGAGVLLGALTRLAALGGVLLSLSFWLVISWNTEPYYFGADLPFLAGFLTLLLAGGGALSVDAALAHRNRPVFA